MLEHAATTGHFDLNSVRTDAAFAALRESPDYHRKPVHFQYVSSTRALTRSRLRASGALGRPAPSTASIVAAAI
jgi:hypothetical protein